MNIRRTYQDWPPALAVTYLLFCCFWLSLTIGGCAYLVFWRGESGWWFVLAVFMASFGFKPYRWYELYTGVDSSKDEEA
ncbi:MAG: hypothetical protein VX464_20715 [Pseudomonadota bacterium]|nr:hypothetical protein [Pseudomonadota bacterium]